MKTAVIYARYSSDNQTEQSIEGQLHVCKEYAQKNDILIVDTYIDRAMTGTNDNRPSFRQMIKDSSKHKWDYILVYKMDRFSRNKYEATIHRHTLKTNGVKLLSAMENIPDTPEGRILESLLEGMNQYFSEELSQKINRGMRESRQKGWYLGGNILYGYKLNGKKLVIDEEAAQVVRYMFEQYAAGVYIKDMIDAMTEKGMLYKGKPFHRFTVYSMLRNVKYTGVYKHNEESVSNMYPQIISPELFKKVNERFPKEKNGKRSVRADYWLKHKIFCGYCKEPLTSGGGTARNGELKRYYKCKGKLTHKGPCQLKPSRKEFLEEFIVNAIIQKLSNPQVMEYMVENLSNVQDEVIKEKNTLKYLINEKNKVDKALANLVAAIERGIMSNTTNKRLHELENQKEELEKQILLEESRTSAKVSTNEIREFYEKALMLEGKMLINYTVNSIYLYNDKVEIQLNSPLKNHPDDNSQGVLLCNEIMTIPYRTQLGVNRYKKILVLISTI